MRTADGYRQRTWDKGQQHPPGNEAWLIGEQRASGEKIYYLANLPAATNLRTLATTIKVRWICEQSVSGRKRSLGLSTSRSNPGKVFMSGRGGRREVIDDDLGHSAAGAAPRAGFERMVAEVCLDVGAICSREAWRFARSSLDWQQLIEMCRVVDTVRVDQETIYVPRHGNDRMLLRLKGRVRAGSVARSRLAPYEKTCRRELFVAAPVAS